MNADLRDYKNLLVNSQKELEEMLNITKNLKYDINKDASWQNILTIISGLRRTIHRELKQLDVNGCSNVALKYQCFEQDMRSIKLTFKSRLNEGAKYSIKDPNNKLY
jgi:hypothetical protein